jgi:hypothetical protein
MNYVILSSYINFSKKVPFITVFPQYKSYYERYDKVIHEAVNKIYQEMVTNKNNKPKIVKKGEVSEEIVPVNTDELVVEKIYNKFIDVVRIHYQVNDNKKTDNTKVDKRIIKNIITNIKHTDTLYSIL